MDLSRPENDAWTGLRHRFRGRDVATSRDEDLSDPVTLARRQLFALWRHDREQLKHLRPIHRHWLSEAEHRPLGFARLVLEAARHHCLRDPRDRGAAVDAAAAHLADFRLREIDEGTWTDLGALAGAYRADEARAAGRVQEAEELLAEAEAGLRADCDPEVHATVLEIGAEIDRDLGRLLLAEHRLEQAEQLLRDHPVSDRHAETLLRQGLLWLHRQHGRRAVEPLRRALDELTATAWPRLRLEILHHLAFAEYAAGDHGSASERLKRAEPLYQVGNPALFQQRQWLLARILLAQGRPEEAEPLLILSISVFARQGHGRDALRSLEGLMKAYSMQGKLTSERLRQLAEQYEELLTSPAVEELSSARLRRIREVLEEARSLMRARLSPADLSVN